MNHAAIEKTSFRGVLFRHITALIFRFFGKFLMELGKKNARLTRLIRRAPRGFSLDSFEINGFYCEMLIPDRAVEGKVILLLHGGAYIMGYISPYRYNACRCAKKSGNVRVLSIDYRLAPEHPFPAALEDGISAFKWLLEKGYPPDQIIIMGDSAGGGLALAVSMALRDRGEAIPGALVLMSPWTDLPGEGSSHKEKYDVDPMFGKKAGGGSIASLLYTNDKNLKNPYVSPAYGNFKGLPPMLIHVGEYEVLLSDSISVADNATKEGIPVEFKIWKGMFHVFQMYYLLIPEAKQSVDRICRYMKEQFGLCSDDNF